MGKNLPKEGGLFEVTPNMEPLLIHITANIQSWVGSQGCIITEFDSSNNKITIGGY